MSFLFQCLMSGWYYELRLEYSVWTVVVTPTPSLFPMGPGVQRINLLCNWDRWGEGSLGSLLLSNIKQPQACSLTLSQGT